MTNLPKDRIRMVRPFEHVGCDYTSHIFVRDNNNQVRKMYIILYTCLTLRAVFLDLVPDMSTLTFLMSFQRFSNIYGVPLKLYSDNAKSFISGGDALYKSLTSDLFTDHLRKNNIQHCRIPIYSAWVGSCWERQIRIVKSCLYKTVGRAKLTYFELLTSLCLQLQM